MATPILDATPGSPNANSYATLEEANAYFDRQVYQDDWLNITDGDLKTRAMMTATSMLDNYITWHGVKWKDTQRLAWPQYGHVDKYGTLIDETTIPQFLIDATAELAKDLLNKNLEEESPLKGFSRLKVDVIDITLDIKDRAKVVSEKVLSMIQSFGSLDSVIEANVAVITRRC